MSDKQFFREYSKTLAKALQDNEENVPTLSKDKLVHNAYVALCHDDPRVVSDEACRALATSLTNQSPRSFFLSDRLVDGIRQATLRFKPTQVSPEIPSPSSLNNNTDKGKIEEVDDNEEPEASFSSFETASASGYASLAVAAFCKVPLECCLSSDQKMVEQYLGSFRTPPQPADSTLLQDLETHADVIREERIANITGQLTDEKIDSDKKLIDGEHSIQEVFAEESDPDDFEFESGYNYQQDTLSAWQDDSIFDPVALSKPVADSIWIDLQRAICDLLSELKYSKVAPLSKQEWKKNRVSGALTELTLTLLVRQSSDISSNTPLLDGHDELRHLGIQPLFVLRDRAMDGSRDNDALDDYLTLLQTLLAVDAALHQNNTRPSSKEQFSLAPATIVGLSSLSALCNSTDFLVSSKENRNRIRRCVLENVEELSSILERSSPVPKDTIDDGNSNEIPSWVRLVMTILPLIHVVTNVQSDGTPVLDQTTSTTVSFTVTNAEAQLFLNSGLFRELLLLFTRTHDDTASVSAAALATTSVARIQLLRSILVVCVQSPNLLAKYAWRVPEFSRILGDSDFQQQYLVDSMLWALLGTLCLSGGPSRLRLKSPGSSMKAMPTVETCRESSVGNFRQLCDQVVEAVKNLKEIREIETNNDEKKEKEEDWKKQHQEVMVEFGRFTSLLVSCSSLATLWLSVYVESSAALPSLKKSVQDVRSEVASMPSARRSDECRVKKTADDDKCGTPSSRVNSHEEEMVGVRKGVKIISLLLQQQSDGISEYRPSNISSKTD